MSKEIRYNLSEKAVIYGLSVIVGIVTTIIMLLFSTAFYLATDMNDALVSPLSALCVGVGSLLSGFLSSKKIKSNGILNGLICGGILFLLITFVALFFSGGGFSLISLIHSAIILVSGMIGGIAGVLKSYDRSLI